MAEIHRQSGAPLRAEVVGFRDDLTVLYPLSDLSGVRRGNRVRLIRTTRWLRVGTDLLGRVIDAEGNAIDGKPQPVLGRPHLVEPQAAANRAPAPASTSRCRPASARSTAC